MRKLVVLLVVALVAVPGAALAAKPPKPETVVKDDRGSHGKRPKTVMFVLRGKLSKFTAAQGETNGSISIEVRRANHHGKALRGVTLTFAVTAKTKVVLNGAATVADGDRGIVMVRAPKRADAAALQAAPARMVVDQQKADSDS